MNLDQDKASRIEETGVANARIYAESSNVNLADGFSSSRDFLPWGTYLAKRAIAEFQFRKGLLARVLSRHGAETVPPAYDFMYREDLAEGLARSITEIDKSVVTTELRSNDNLLNRIGAWFNRNPLFTALGGTTIAASTSLGVVADYLPMDGTTLSLLMSSSTLGAEGTIRSVYNFIQSNIGRRGRPVNIQGLYGQELEGAIAAHQNNRVIERNDQPSTLEQELLEERRKRFVDTTMRTLDNNVTSWTSSRDVVGKNLREAYSRLGDRLQIKRLDNLLFNRWARLSMNVLGIGVATMLTYGVMDLSHKDRVLTWGGSDPIYGSGSSWHGKMQGFIGEDRRLANVPFFDPITHPNDAALLEGYRNNNPVEYARVIAALDRYSRNHGRLRTGSNGDLLNHVETNRVPASTHDFIGGVLGKKSGNWWTDLLDSVKYSRYR